MMANTKFSFRTILSRLRPLTRVIPWLVIAFMAAGLVTTVASIIGIGRVSVEHPATPPIINDVTQLNPIPAGQVLTPRTTDDVVAAVKAHGGPISIGGGRYSMGGQTATPGTLQLDMRQMNRVLAF